MKVTINGKTATINQGVTIAGFLEQRDINPKMVIVELNYELPPREEWDRLLLQENDNLEVIKIIGGG